MRNKTGVIPILAFFSTMSPARADPGDYLEIYPTALTINGHVAPYNFKPGQQVLLNCDWAVTAADSHRQWYAGGKEHRFSVRIVINGDVVGSFEGVLGPRTRIGIADGSRGFSVNGTSGPVTWAAATPGEYHAVCVVNEPKTVSDRWPQNNTTEPVAIRVSSRDAPAGRLKRPKPAAAEQRPRQSAPPVFATTKAPTASSGRAQQRPASPVSNLVIEVEDLIPTAVVSGGRMLRQEMAEFGSGWGADAQLFWRPPVSVTKAPHLLSNFEVPRGGVYELVLFYTAAPDFGEYSVFVDGRPVARLDGYGPGVVLRSSSLGRFDLAAGRHELAFEITGKHRLSTGNFLGLDRVQLTLVR